jgi:hypothetical protein
MNAEKNHFAINFADDTLKIHVNDKLVFIGHKRELGPNVLGVIFEGIKGLIRLSADKEEFESRIVMLQFPSRGPCKICGRHANLLGGLCYTCSPHESNIQQT